MGMMILDARDLRALAEEGLLTEVIMKCTVGGIAEQGGTVVVKPTEEEKPPKKKRATKKKAEEPATVAEASQEVAEATAPSPVQVEVEETPTAVAPEVEVAPVEPQVEFNIEMLAQKAIGLMDAGKGEALQNLLRQFGVASLPELAPESYGEFYSAMEEM